MAVRQRSQRPYKAGRSSLKAFCAQLSKDCEEQQIASTRTPTRGCARTKQITFLPVQEHKWPSWKPTPSSYADSRTFPFFELPIELRDQIYSYLVVAENNSYDPILDAVTLQQDRKKRLSAENARSRLQDQRVSAGKRIRATRIIQREPVLHLNILRASRRLHAESTRHLYNNNRFALSLGKLPSTFFDAPYGWDLTRIVRLDLNLQIKDAPRMDRHTDWTTFFSLFPALRFLRLIPSFHPRYYEWARDDMCDWASTNYIQKAFFRELYTAIPHHMDVQWGVDLELERCTSNRVDLIINQDFLREMESHLGGRKAM